MNDRQLRSFLQAADQKSFSRAAAAAYISTPALIQQINLLEKSLGFSLFVRDHHGIELTDAGREFYDAAAEILRIYEAARERGLALEQSRSFTLRIAYPSEQFPPFLLSAYEAFRRAYPGAEVIFVQSPFREHFRQILSGEADLSILAEPSAEWLGGLRFLPLCQDTYSFCMRPGHPLSRLCCIAPADLADVRILCGRYPYMKVPFSGPLEHCSARLELLEKEYDMDVRATCLLSESVFVIHSLWSQVYRAFLTVVPSKIPAGRVGVLYSAAPSAAAERFLSFLKQEQSFTTGPG